MYGAVDIGASKTLVCVFSEDGKLLEKNKFETPKNYLDFLKVLESEVNKLKYKDLKITCVATPGKIDRNKAIGIAFGNLPWVNVSIRKDFEPIFRSPIIIENDAKLAGLYEASTVAKGYHKALYITISTGIGGGLIIDGKLSKDFQNIEPGQMLLEHKGKLERWENLASGKAIFNQFHQKASEITDPKIWYQVAHNIALGVIDLIALLTPDIIVIGGGVGAHFEKFKDRLMEDLKIYQNALLTIPPVVKATKAEEAVAYGCYLNAKGHLPE